MDLFDATKERKEGTQAHLELNGRDLILDRNRGSGDPIVDLVEGIYLPSSVATSHRREPLLLGSGSRFLRDRVETLDDLET